jgi:hypothetical protein
MKKLSLLISIYVLSMGISLAQNISSTAQQSLNLALANVIQVGFATTGTATGSTVALPFTSVSDYLNGVSCAPQQLNVSSNTAFNISVSVATGYFNIVNGGAQSMSSMPVTGVLDVMLMNNQTGGVIAPAYNNFGGGLSTSPATVLTGGNSGTNKTFKIKYKATPGFAYSGGTYVVDVIYTATQQ